MNAREMYQETYDPAGVREAMERDAYVLSDWHARVIIEESEEDCPREAVGLIWESAGASGYIKFTNRSEVDGEYAVDAEEQVDTWNMLAEIGAEHVAVWHSHPTADARPSEVDVEHADPTVLYLIYSVAQKSMRAWRISGGEANERRLICDAL